MIYPKNYEDKVGFDQVRQLLRERCLSTLGQDRVDEMAFSSSFQEVNTWLDQTAEMLCILEGDTPLPDSHYLDMRPALARVRTEGLWLDERELYDLRRSMDTIGRITTFLRQDDDQQAQTSPWPCLRALADDVPRLPQVTRRIDQVLTPYGEIRDNASPQLAAIRRSLNQTRAGIQRLLTGILRTAQAEGLVERDASPTLRDGRLVIPVASAMKRRIGGIVHDESASGRTAYIEPAEVVEANNRVRELEGEERREIVRILTELTDSLRPDIPDLLLSYAFLAEVDFIRAKALLARRLQTVKPALTETCGLDWRMAVHPLLLLTLEGQGKRAVPLDIEMNDQQRILIISGPNAGGKSVCLKTVGLLQYMLQCGLLLPMHEGSQAGLFESIFIDIGDEQSIAGGLSTYSSHLTNMKQMLRFANDHSLILIDELGSGTEPRIGGALAEAVLRRLHERHVQAVITTHYHNLKQFAEDHEGVVSGAMLYDRQLMQPLFQLQVGQPGSSFAVEIARKIGLPDDVIADASAIVGSDYINADRYLLDIARDKRYWENKRQQIRQREKQLEETLSRYQAEAEELHAQRREIIQRAREEAEQLMLQTNARIEKTIREIKEAQAERERTRKAREELQEWRTRLQQEEENKEDDITRRMEQLSRRQARKEERRKKKAVAGNAPRPSNPGPDKAQQAQRPWQAGDTVRLKGQQTIGRVMAVDDGGRQVVVAFGLIKTTVSADRLLAAKVVQPTAEMSTRNAGISPQTQDSMHERRLNFHPEIDVRGMRGDEALQAVTYFIDDAILVGANRVRILHGTGSGILRTLIRQYLATVPQVTMYHDEHVQLGGAGITVAELE